jgi:hypothetical protein
MDVGPERRCRPTVPQGDASIPVNRGGYCEVWHLRPQQGLDRAALVHGPVALGGLLEREGEVEDLAGVDLAVPDQVDELGQEARTGASPPCRCTREQNNSSPGNSTPWVTPT